MKKSGRGQFGKIGRPSPRYHLGVTLIEVLISLLIMAIGLLGMTGLQTESLRNTQVAYFRTQATILGNDVVERVRANLQGEEAGSYNNIDGLVNAGCNSLTGCTSAQLAGNDIAEWKAALLDNLPLGSGTVCVDASPQDGTAAAMACDGAGIVYAVKIWWDEDRDGTAEKRFTMSFQP